MKQFPGLVLVLCTASCAPNPLSTAGPLGVITSSEKALRFDFTVAGNQIEVAEGLGYYLVLDSDGQPSDGPLANGAAPLTFPFPDARSYLPFVRDESQVLDRNPVLATPTSWTDYFVLGQEAGRLTMWQGQLNPDGSVNARVRELKNGTDWGVQGNKVQVVVPLSWLASGSRVLSQLEANLAVGVRPEATTEPRSGLRALVERWSADPSTFISITTDGAIQRGEDASPFPLYPEKLGPGLDGQRANFTGFMASVQ